MDTIEYERQEKERLALLQEVGQCITSWARVEEALYNIFHLCIGATALGPSSAAFIAVENFRAKIGMTDGVVRAYLLKSQLVGVWARREKEAISLSKRRNFIVHGQVFMLAVGKAKPRAAVMASHLDMSHYLKRKGRGRPPRLHLPDVKAATIECISLSKRLNEFYKKLPRHPKP